LESVKSNIFRLDAKLRELEQRIKTLEDDKREEEEMIAAAFEPPSTDRRVLRSELNHMRDEA